ncbi:DUF3649 domain-containing protein [Pseudomonas syringae pv. tagetis]|uniref:Iron uptake protein n=2 Tax=Pseudomonas syringae group TaxID=136849 RepID=A0A0P9KEB2_9PSED|nr:MULTISPECIES: DUF3649 domain-containing protein [Pseudomonas syringae group]KAA8695769.1 DUF3649 domain-containing protein [Pseudomonas caricapapayae]KPW63111.1 Uncharacterized protein ALO80_02316 [Pseudomonas caricapapayae]KPY88347.1 Uncharacterized protein ALO44_01114 [Pseudomonas syringae pv. tagetis]RMM08109.1 hypothetical protein ALQ84_00128 [Pseudomonas caricapapayae]RMV78703.1 hypothetical protein ALP05_01193 [Pseudomonas caricapapayae]
MDVTPASRPLPEKRTAKARSKRLATGYRLAVTSRALAAVFAGYLLASVVSICVAQWLPIPRAESVVAGMMLSFLVYLVAVLWCFACRTVLQAWVGVLAPCALLGAACACGRWLL